jgi:hypothetical protein
MERLYPFRLDRFYAWTEPHALGVRLIVRSGAKETSTIEYTTVKRTENLAIEAARQHFDGRAKSQAPAPLKLIGPPKHKPKRRYKTSSKRTEYRNPANQK